MKALDEYFLMVVFTLLLNRLQVSAYFIFNLDREEKHDNYERIMLVYKLKRDTVVHFISDGLENQILFY